MSIQRKLYHLIILQRSVLEGGLATREQCLRRTRRPVLVSLQATVLKRLPPPQLLEHGPQPPTNQT